MKYLSKMVTLQEVPNEVSLSFLITGCPNRCKGCHSSNAWDGEKGIELTPEVLEKELDKIGDLITCVLFLGGEWEPIRLAKLLAITKNRGLKTCLYTGATSLHGILSEKLDYVKYGKYDEKLGGLESPKTNQRFYNNNSGEDLTHLFNK